MKILKIIKTPHVDSESEKQHQRSMGMNMTDDWKILCVTQLSAQLFPISYWQALHKESDREVLQDPCTSNSKANAAGKITRETILSILDAFTIADVRLLIDVLEIDGFRSARAVTNEVQKLLHHGCLKVVGRSGGIRTFKAVQSATCP
jgi:hypothetical protein